MASHPDAVEFAPAKINLALHVLGRRPDGYHDIDSLVAFADIGDELALSDQSEDLTISIDGPFAAALKEATDHLAENLVERAAGAISQFAGVSPTGRLRLTKNLPIGAGIGGGSADAAATLRLLARALDCDADQLASLSRPLGADVPMCFRSRSVRAHGDGDVLEDVTLPALPLVLAYPAVEVSTARVFGALTKADNAPLPPLPDGFGSIDDVVLWLGETRNDLQSPARLQAPIIDEALAELAAANGSLLARMSGSGSTCFGVFPSQEAARSAALAVNEAHPDWWVRAATTLAA